MTIWNLLTCGLLFAAVIFTIGHAGHEAAVEEQKLYCAMVAEGTWPDYNENFEEICK